MSHWSIRLAPFHVISFYSDLDISLYRILLILYSVLWWCDALLSSFGMSACSSAGPVNLCIIVITFLIIFFPLVEYTWRHSATNTCTLRLQIRLANFINSNFGTSNWFKFFIPLFVSVNVCCFVAGMFFFFFCIVKIYTQNSGALVSVYCIISSYLIRTRFYNCECISV